MLALSNLRKGYRYAVKNHGEYHEFEVIEMLSGDDYLVKDLHTLETYPLSDLVRYGIGKDYDVIEL
jgi:hypothetical protein